MIGSIVSEGLPSRFGFPLAVHPHDGDTIYVIPEESDERRLVPDGALCIYRSKNRGDTWEVLTDSLPQVHAFQNVLRAAMTTDACDPPGVYVGTQGGHILASRDAGDHWTLLFKLVAARLFAAGGSHRPLAVAARQAARGGVPRSSA